MEPEPTPGVTPPGNGTGSHTPPARALATHAGDRARFLALFVLVFLPLNALHLVAKQPLHDGIWWSRPFLDSRDYTQLALEFARGNFQQPEAFFLGPLFPALLAPLIALTGDALFAPRLLNLLLNNLSAILIGLLAARIAGRAAALAAAVLWFTTRTVLFHEMLVLQECTAAFGMALALYAVARLLPDDPNATAPPLAPGRILPPFLAGLAIGLAALARANALVLLLPAIVLLAIPCRSAPQRASCFARLTRSAGALLLGLFLAVSPAVVHNLRAEPDAFAITTNSGLNLFIGNHEEATGYYTLPPALATEKDMRGRAIAERATGRSNLTSVEISRWWRGRALLWIQEHPARALSLALTKFRLFFAARDIPQLYDEEVMRADDLPWLRLPWLGFPVLLAFAVAGVVVRIRRPASRPIVLFLLAALGLYVGSLLPYFVTGRYRVAALPIFAALAGPGLVEVLRLLHRREFRRLAAPCAFGLAAAALSHIAEPPIDRENEISQFIGMKASLLIDAQKTDEARRILEARVRVAPSYNVLSNLAALELRARHPEQAEPHLRRAAELRPTDARIFYNLAIACGMQQKHADTRAALERALALDPHISRDAWLNLARACIALGDRPAAAAALREHLQRQPADSAAAQLLNTLSP